MSPALPRHKIHTDLAHDERAPEIFEPGTPIGLHLRVHRLLAQESDRHVYLVNDVDPRWHTKKCWGCGFRYSPPKAQSCSYCASPLRPRLFLMTSRWHARGASLPVVHTTTNTVPRIPHRWHCTTPPAALWYTTGSATLLCEILAPIGERTLLQRVLSGGWRGRSPPAWCSAPQRRHVDNSKGEHQLFDLEVPSFWTASRLRGSDAAATSRRGLCARSMPCDPEDGTEDFLRVASGKWKTRTASRVPHRPSLSAQSAG